MNILGISCYYHDAAAALLQDGVLVAAAEEERFTRRKHDARFPVHAIAFCLRQAHISGNDIDYAVFYEKPLLKLERILTTSFGSFPRSWKVFREGTVSWLKERLWIKDRIAKDLGIAPERILFVEHHLAHAASAFFCSPFKESAVLTVDGVGECATATMGKAVADWDGTGINSIELSHELRFPHSLGLLYSVFTAFLGFEVNEGEYKVMGMAPYGYPKYLDEISKIVRVFADGSIFLNLEYFSFQHSIDRSFSGKFVELFGPPRRMGSEFFSRGTGSTAGEAECAQNQRYADVAASIQRFTEDVLIKMANHLHAATSLTKLCMAGGVALNSVGNGRILRETAFTDIFIQPAAGDSGAAVGAAFYVWHVVLGKPRAFVLENAYLGEAYDDGAIADFLASQGIRSEIFEHEDSLLDLVASEIQRGKVVGWFQGRFEWGPRALGNRSILADPRRSEMKDVVNSKIKFREPFRPFAPVILEEKTTGYFDGIADPAACYPARYMLLVLPWKGEAGDRIPAVNHMGTGRVQTIRREWNPRYYRLVEKFAEATGVPVLMNTSFNLRGEPIVASPRDAMNTFMNSGLDLLVLGNQLVRK